MYQTLLSSKTNKQYYAIFVYNGDESRYVLCTKHGVKLKTIEEIKDCREMLIFETKNEVVNFIKFYLQTVFDLSNYDKLDICKIVPSWVDHGTFEKKLELWYEDIDFKNYDIKKGKVCGLKLH